MSGIGYEMADNPPCASRTRKEERAKGWAGHRGARRVASTGRCGCRAVRGPTRMVASRSFEADGGCPKGAAGVRDPEVEVVEELALTLEGIVREKVLSASTS